MNLYTLSTLPDAETAKSITDECYGTSTNVLLSEIQAAMFDGRYHVTFFQPISSFAKEILERKGFKIISYTMANGEFGHDKVSWGDERFETWM